MGMHWRLIDLSTSTSTNSDIYYILNLVYQDDGGQWLSNKVGGPNDPVEQALQVDCI